MDTSDLTDQTSFDSAELQKLTLSQIQQLQAQEQALYSQLESSEANTPYEKGDKYEIVKKINELSQMRMTMFEQLQDMYGDLQGRVAQSRVDLVDQMTVAGVVEQQLNNAKASLNELTNSKNQKMRMVEINTYYSQKYRAQTELVKTILMFAVPCLVVAIIVKKGFIPGNIGNGILAIIIAIGIIVVFRKWWDISSRSNMVFDEYKWNWDPDANSPTVLEYDMDQLSGTKDALEDDANSLMKEFGFGCVGEKCCSTGTKYDKDKNQCVEGFAGITSIESKNPICPWKHDPSTVKPFTGGVFDGNYERV